MAENPPKRRKIAGIGMIPNWKDHVFLPITDQPDLTNHQISFLRAAPAVGKSTLGRDLADRKPEKWTYCELSPTVSAERTILDAVQRTVQLENPTLLQALHKLQKIDGHVLIIDEAHLLLGHPICGGVLKSGVTLLLLGACAEARRSSNVAPTEISQRLLWKPRLQVTEEVVKQFNDAGLAIHFDVLKFLANICAHIKGVFMYAIHFFHQNRLNCSSLDDAISQIKLNQKNFDLQLQRSRAVKINNGFDVLEHYWFIKVLLQGPTKDLEPEVLRDLCIKGALLPVCTSKEFTSYAWDDRTTEWGVSNHLMAEYYVGILKDRGYKISWPTDVSSGSDLIARALPSIGFAKVVQQPIFGEVEGQKKLITSLSMVGIPHEDHYNDALFFFLKQFYDVSRPKGSQAGVGNPGLIVTVKGDSCIVIETVLWKNDIGEHRKRFDALEAYRLSKFQCLLIIGPDEDTVQQKVTNTNGGKVEIVGVVVTHSHHEYRVFVKQAGPGSLVEGPFVIPCDCVARSLTPNSDGKLQLRCCQDYTPPETPAGASGVWVQCLKHNDAANQFDELNDAFLIRGTFRHMDDLKMGIAKIVKCTHTSISVYCKEEGTWQKLPPSAKVVLGSTMETSYGFTVTTTKWFSD